MSVSGFVHITFLDGKLSNLRKGKVDLAGKESDLHNEIEVVGYKCRSVKWKKKS